MLQRIGTALMILSPSALLIVMLSDLQDSTRALSDTPYHPTVALHFSFYGHSLMDALAGFAAFGSILMLAGSRRLLALAAVWLVVGTTYSDYLSPWAQNVRYVIVVAAIVSAFLPDVWRELKTGLLSYRLFRRQVIPDHIPEETAHVDEIPVP